MPLAPTSVRLCRYTNRLVRSVALGQDAALRVARMLDALKPPSSGKHQVFTSCPFSLLPIVVNVAYRDGRSVEVLVATNHCLSASNGDLTVTEPAMAMTRVRNELLRLTR